MARFFPPPGRPTINGMPDTKDDYTQFHEQIGKCVKCGAHEDSTNRINVTELLCFHASKPDTHQLNLKEYVDRAQEGLNDNHHGKYGSQ